MIGGESVTGTRVQWWPREAATASTQRSLIQVNEGSDIGQAPRVTRSRLRRDVPERGVSQPRRSDLRRRMALAPARLRRSRWLI